MITVKESEVEHNLWSSSCAMYIKLPVYQGETLAVFFLALPLLYATQPAELPQELSLITGVFKAYLVHLLSRSQADLDSVRCGCAHCSSENVLAYLSYSCGKH